MVFIFVISMNKAEWVHSRGGIQFVGQVEIVDSKADLVSRFPKGEPEFDFYVTPLPRVSSKTIDMGKNLERFRDGNSPRRSGSAGKGR